MRRYIINSLKPLKVEKKDEELLARFIDEINQLSAGNAT